MKNFLQRISYQYTTSTEFERFHAHTARWITPINPWQHQIEFFGGYSNITPKMPVGLSNEGDSWQVNGRYLIPFRPTKKFFHELELGADYKSNDVKKLPYIQAHSQPACFIFPYIKYL